MDNSKLSWFVKLSDDDTSTPKKELFAGTYTPKHDISATIQLWNNRWGTEDVADLKNFVLQLSFERAEDAMLLQYCTVKVNGKEQRLAIAGQKGSIVLPSDIIISGKANNGVTAENRGNYINVDFLFHAADDVQLKENDLKSLIIEVILL